MRKPRKTKGGPPRNMSDPALWQLNCRFTRTQFDQIQSEARESGVSLARFVRQKMAKVLAASAGHEQQTAVVT